MNFMIVGAGLTGSVLARVLAESGFRCVIIEKENWIAGNCHTERDPSTGILLHRFGPHTLHSDNETVWEFLERFCRIYPYAHKKQAWVNGKIYPFPINLTTINQFFGTNLTPAEVSGFLKAEAAPHFVTEPQNFEEAALSSLGKRLYDGFYKGYTNKQWGRDPRNLPAFIFRRLPVHFKNESNVFHHKRQGQPVGGYTQLVERILSHKNITVRRNCEFSNEIFTSEFAHLFYSAPIDRYFNFCFGRLPYRTLYFENEIKNGTFQACGTVNYCDEGISYTRVAEHKHFWPWESVVDRTVITYEYSRECSENDRPYYPIHLSDGNALYRQYVTQAKKENRTSFVGRLGTYRYLDMDKAIEEAIFAANDTIARISSAEKIPAFFGAEYSSH